MTVPSFPALGLSAPLLRALEALGHEHPTPVQAQAIPPLLAGDDLLGVAQTGTGKTAAFALPLLQALAADPRRPAPRAPRALVLAPTRELAAQVAASFEAYARFLRVDPAVAVGGVPAGPQVRALARGVHVLVATPGRLLDLCQQGHADLGGVGHLVLDEADRMLDLGFLPDVRRVIAALPRSRQSMLFSATMPATVARLAATLLRDPVRVEVTPSATTVEKVDQRVFLVERADKRALLGTLLDDPALERALVFTRTKRGADRVARHLAAIPVSAAAIHGNKSQGQRDRALAAFRGGRVRVLVATDLAARGLDVEGITHVVNFDLPNEPESYVHRIGRTARAGREGVALSFCDVDERPYLRDIERAIRRPVPVVESHPHRSSVPYPGRGVPPRPAPASPGTHRPLRWGVRALGVSGRASRG